MRRNRFVPPARAAVHKDTFGHPIFFGVCGFSDLLASPEWPGIGQLNARLEARAGLRFVVQDAALLSENLHYEKRIHARAEVPTREENWHDLFNALIWATCAPIKRALNVRQVEEIARIGPRSRSRAQCALTHFDEAGAVVWAEESGLLAAWDAHDWPAFFGQREAFAAGALRAHVFGHALLEHALVPGRLPTAKCLALAGGDPERWQARLATAIAKGARLTDPQELRPLPLAGLPGWADGQEAADFFDGDCFRPLREGRRYPPSLAGD